MTIAVTFSRRCGRKANESCTEWLSPDCSPATARLKNIAFALRQRPSSAMSATAASSLRFVRSSATDRQQAATVRRRRRRRSRNWGTMMKQLSGECCILKLRLSGGAAGGGLYIVLRTRCGNKWLSQTLASQGYTFRPLIAQHLCEVGQYVPSQ